MIRTGVSFSSYSIMQPVISLPRSFDFTLSYESLRKSSCATCQPKADKVRQTSSTIERAPDTNVLQSAYWTPTMFYQSRNGTFHRVNQIGGATIYYLQVRIHLPTVSGLPISYRFVYLPVQRPEYPGQRLKAFPAVRRNRRFRYLQC